MATDPKDPREELDRFINTDLDTFLQESLEEDCPHNEIVPCEDNPTYGRCTQCGDDTFPLFDEAEAADIEGIADEVFSYIIGRFTYVPINLQPEDRVKAKIAAIIARGRLAAGDEDGG